MKFYPLDKIKCSQPATVKTVYKERLPDLPVPVLSFSPAQTVPPVLTYQEELHQAKCTIEATLVQTNLKQGETRIHKTGVVIIYLRVKSSALGCLNLV